MSRELMNSFTDLLEPIAAEFGYLGIPESIVHWGVQRNAMSHQQIQAANQSTDQHQVEHGANLCYYQG